MSAPFGSRPRADGVAVKICGLTRRVDAELAVALGADAIGVVFAADSARRVDAARAADVLAGAPPQVTRVGVFRDAPLDEVLRAVERCALDCVQLTGSEDATYARGLRSRGVRVVRALAGGGDVAEHGYPADGWLLDGASGGVVGGTGVAFDWTLARELPWPRERVALAGGLDAGNVARAIAIVRPAAVDVCSGVEAEKGIKDQARMAAFIRAARETAG